MRRGPSKHKTVGPTVGLVMATVGKQLAQMPRPSRLSADYKFKVGLRSANSWLQPTTSRLFANHELQAANLNNSISTSTPYLSVLGVQHNIFKYTQG
jgi:hypothetical protein